MLGILDYGMGNLSSVQNVVNYLGAEYKIIKSELDFSDCTHLIIPGVGAYEKAMNNIHASNYISEITKFANSGKPVLGICLGMQLLADRGFEPNETKGLGLVSGEVVMMDFENVRVPHVGWNGINIINNHPILNEVKTVADFYFVHSYYFKPATEISVIATTDYGENFTSIISNERRNVVGIQFHPEKSQKQGLKIMENFIKMEPC
jgi:glutamine amidotransferase